MPEPTPNTKEIKVGAEVTTVHGEKLKVLEVSKDRNGRKVLAESGGTKCWFYDKSLKLA